MRERETRERSHDKTIESGSSDDPCSEIYQGKDAFSEPESRYPSFK